MPRTRPIGVLACSATLSLVAAGGPLTTVEQRNSLRSPRSPRSADVSANGRFVAFESQAALVSADDDTQPDIYVLDRSSGTVTLETGDLAGETESANPRLSGDGRLLVFELRTRDGDREPRLDIVLRDRTAGTNRSLTGSLEDSGVFAWSRGPAISEDGRFVAFSSASTTMVRGADANGALEDVYLLRVSSGEVERVSLTSAGLQLPRGTSILPSLSADGRWIAFASTARLDETDPARQAHEAPVRSVFLRDLITGITTRVSRAPRHQANGDSSVPSLSGDGRFVAFASNASNLSDDDRNRGTDVFVFDRETAALTRVTRAADNSSANGTSANPVISGDGRYVAFQSEAANLVCAARCPHRDEDINLLWDVFVFDRTTGKVVRISEDELGGWMEWSMGPSIDRSGAVVAFSSRHPVDTDDRREDLDLFVRQLNTN
jgi:Tol biopolymer transport system component